MRRKRVAILISGRGSNMASLIEAAKAPDYPAEITLVVSNRPDAPGIALAQSANVPTEVLDHRSFNDRAAFEEALQTILDRYQIELICLAGFMRLFTAEFAQRWRGRMLNIHPALLPAFKGLHTHERALAEGAKTHGATVHFVSPEMDAGPIVAQGEVPVLPDDTPQTLAARVLEVEHQIYPRALKAVAEGRVQIS